MGAFERPDIGNVATTESTLERRERLADRYGSAFGRERVFPALVEAMLQYVPPGSHILEVGAATGILTRPLLARSAHVTAMEPSQGMLRRLLETDVASSDRLTILRGMTEDLPVRVDFDVAVVTFTPRRGVALLRLLSELAQRVESRVVMLLDVDGTLDWAYVARSAAQQGFGIHIDLIGNESGSRLAAVVVAEVASWRPHADDVEWGVDAQEIDVPFPAPRGAATRIIRYFLSTGSRALLLRTDPRGVERLYGNLRTAVHRIAKGEVTVRREGNAIQVVRLPPAD